MADASGFVAVGCQEILIHADDIAAGLGLKFAPPAELAGRVVRRLFPWAPTDVEPWAALPDRARLGPDWWIHCAPLTEWDGVIKRRTSPPAWT